MTSHHTGYPWYIPGTWYWIRQARREYIRRKREKSKKGKKKSKEKKKKETPGHGTISVDSRPVGAWSLKALALATAVRTYRHETSCSACSGRDCNEVAASVYQ